MTPFDYTSVLSSIIVGLALTDILVSVHRLLRAGPKVKWDWAAPVAALLVTLTLIQIWWLLYRPTDAGMTIGQFLPLLVELVLLFLLASAALPDEVPAEGVDLKAYYDRNRPYFWALFTAALAWTMVMQAIEEFPAGGSLVSLLIGRSADLAALAVFASMIFIRQRWWHVIGFLLLAVGPVGWLSRSL